MNDGLVERVWRRVEECLREPRGCRLSKDGDIIRVLPELLNVVLQPVERSDDICAARRKCRSWIERVAFLIEESKGAKAVVDAYNDGIGIPSKP